VNVAALHADYEGRDPEPLLRRAAELNPTSSAPRIRLGLAAELRGDAVDAERWLLAAFAVDRQFETRWTLANFYLRQGRADSFWTWIRSALEMSYGDRRPAFDLCWHMSSDGAEILSKAIPDRAPVVADYVISLIGQPERIDALPAAALRLASLAQGRSLLPSRDVLLIATDVLLTANKYSAAAAVWSAMGRCTPDGVTDPAFSNQASSEQATGHGFDWRPLANEGVSHVRLEGGRGRRIRLNGRQPESVALLLQFVGGLRAGGRYAVRWEADSDGLPSPSGVTWNIAGASAELAVGELAFRAPAEVAVLELRYVRPAGQVRAEGRIDLRRITVTSLPQ
jgi:hypothetical protein